MWTIKRIRHFTRHFRSFWSLFFVCSCHCAMLVGIVECKCFQIIFVAWRPTFPYLWMFYCIEKKILEQLSIARFYHNLKFPYFSPEYFLGRKARIFKIKVKIVQISVVVVLTFLYTLSFSTVICLVKQNFTILDYEIPNTFWIVMALLILLVWTKVNCQ